MSKQQLPCTQLILKQGSPIYASMETPQSRSLQSILLTYLIT